MRLRFFPTRLGIIVGALVLVPVAMIVTVVLRAPPADSLESWTYPGSSLVTNLNESSVVGALFSVPDNFTNVANWYRARLGLGRFPSTVFVASGSIFARHGREAGVIASPSVASSSELLFSKRRNRMMILHVSQATGETNTRVWLVSRPAQSPINAPPALSVIRSLAFPNSLEGAGGGTMNISAVTFTAKNTFRTVRQYFAGNEPVSSGRISLERLPDGTSSRVAPLPLAPRVATNEAAFVYVTAKALALIHVTPGTNQTQITIGAIKD